MPDSPTNALLTPVDVPASVAPRDDVEPGLPGRRRHGPSRTMVGALSLLAGAGLWELYGRSIDSNLFIPTFSQVAAALWRQLGTSEFWAAYADTLEPFVYGWLSALLVGVAVGLLMGQSRVVTGLIAPYLAFFNALPVSTIVPIIVIALGIDLPARAMVVFLFAIVDVVLTAAAGSRYVERDQLDMARSFGYGRFGRFRKVAFPGSMPGIVAAIRIGTGRAIVGMIVMELLLVSSGVGKLISRYKDTFASADLYAVVVSLGIFGLVMMGLTRALEKRALRWRPNERQDA